MNYELSILIPVYNGNCLAQVQELHRQAEAIAGLTYEILVADDGSTDSAIVEANRQIDSFSHSRYIIRAVNAGRAAIRNFLAQQAQYGWLLFLDCDMTVCRADFLQTYLECSANPTAPRAPQVVYGGYVVGKGQPSNLRWLYEQEAAPRHTAEERRKQPYRDFHTANFLIRRDVMLAHPFDERFRHYGYEDVLLGKQLRQAGIPIAHIDNPVGFDSFEDNPSFVSKTEEGLHTLYEFRSELRGYNGLLTLVDGIHIGLVKHAIRFWHRLFGGLERRQLYGRNPNLMVFKLYKLGYYLNIH